MIRAQRLAIITLLDREMFQHGSWCGETHLQKATFVLQELLGAKTEYDFILYKHGPFSFDLRDDLASMQADGLLELVVRHPEYGPSYLPTEFADIFLKRFSKTVGAHEAQAGFVAKYLADKNVGELEKIATALFILKHSEIKSREKRAEELIRLKPHISERSASLATKEIDRLAEQSKEFMLQDE